ncbi:MAG: hypothetical protein V3V99_01560 [candidate division Zixibacteria bacterium]
MKSTTKKNSNPKQSKKAPNYRYIDEHAKDFAFFDYVRVRSGARGSLLSFGKSHPESNEFIIFKEILIPLDVAYSLKDILINQFDEMEESGLINIEKPSKKKNKEVKDDE